MKKKKKKPPCRFQNCCNPCLARGLCQTHYNQLRRKVHQGETTWEELEASNLVPPVARRGPTPRADTNGQTSCLIKHCSGLARTRGLCNSCYQAAIWRIHADETTWEELESFRLALPVHFSRPFALALEQARAQQK